MIGVVVYLTVVVAYSALLCGHQGEDWPPGWMWRRWQARRGRQGGCAGAGASRSPSCDSRVAGTTPGPADSRLRPQTQLPPTGPPATSPSRPQETRWSAPQDIGGRFLAPTPQRPAQSHTARQETP